MDFTNVELFKNLLEINAEAFHIDLHNDYICVDVGCAYEILTLKFKNRKMNEYILVQFNGIRELKLSLPLINEGLTLDNLHRGRYENAGELYDEYEGRKCFYIEFYEGGSIELLCMSATMVLPNSMLS